MPRARHAFRIRRRQILQVLLISQLAAANDKRNFLASTLEANFAYQFESKGFQPPTKTCGVLGQLFSAQAHKPAGRDPPPPLSGTR